MSTTNLSTRNVTNDLNLDVGYSSNGEDLNSVDTEYVEPDHLPELVSDEFHILHMNIHGLLNKQDSLSRLLTTIGGRNKVSVVSLNETWLRKETINKINIPGFTFTGKHRSGKNGGGVGFLVSENVRYREVNDLLPELKTLEYKCIEIMMKSKSLLLVTVYRAPNQSLPLSITDFDTLTGKDEK